MLHISFLGVFTRVWLDSSLTNWGLKNCNTAISTHYLNRVAHLRGKNLFKPLASCTTLQIIPENKITLFKDCFEKLLSFQLGMPGIHLSWTWQKTQDSSPTLPSQSRRWIGVLEVAKTGRDLHWLGNCSWVAVICSKCL